MKGDEAFDPLARLGRDLGRLGRSAEAGDEVELTSPRERDHAGEVRLAQFDRRAPERAPAQRVDSHALSGRGKPARRNGTVVGPWRRC